MLRTLALILIVFTTASAARVLTCELTCVRTTHAPACHQSDESRSAFTRVAPDYCATDGLLPTMTAPPPSAAQQPLTAIDQPFTRTVVADRGQITRSVSPPGAQAISTPHPVSVLRI